MAHKQQGSYKLLGGIESTSNIFANIAAAPARCQKYFLGRSFVNGCFAAIYKASSRRKNHTNESPKTIGIKKN